MWIILIILIIIFIIYHLRNILNSHLFHPRYVKINKDELNKNGWVPIIIKTCDSVNLSAIYKINSDVNKWILFFHGNGQYIGEQLNIFNKNYCILIVDYRGYGESDNVNPTYSNIMKDAYASWDYLINEHKCDPSDITLVGLSLGGAIATKLAYKLIINKNTIPDKLVIINSFSSITNLIFDIIGLKKDSILYHFINYFSLVPFNTCEYLRYINNKTKIIIMHSENDNVIPYKEGLINWNVIKSDNNEFIKLTGDHCNLNSLALIT
jgi:hypothetical protein